MQRERGAIFVIRCSKRSLNSAFSLSSSYKQQFKLLYRLSYRLSYRLLYRLLYRIQQITQYLPPWPCRDRGEMPQNWPVSSAYPSRLAVIYINDSSPCHNLSIFSKIQAVKSRPLRRGNHTDGLHCFMSTDRSPLKPALFYTAGIILSSKKWKNHQHQQRED